MSEEPALRPGNPIGPALLTIGKELLGAGSLDPQKSEASAIHSLRRRMKRWRAFLRLIEPVLGEEAVRLRTEARDLARLLAGARDAQAAIDAMADLGGDYESLTATSLASITRRIEDVRASVEALTLTPEAREKLNSTIARTANEIEQWPVEDVDFRDIAVGLTEGYRRARRAAPEDWSTATAEDFHELRQRVVTHRYQMELIEPAWPRLSKAWVAEAQRLRERLGKHQDLAVLSKLIEPKALLARWRGKLAPVIEARQRDHIEASMRHAGRLFAEKPQAFQSRIESMWEAES